MSARKREPRAITLAEIEVTTAPRGWAKAYKPGRVVDIEKAVERFVDAPPNAMRIGL